MSGAMCWVLLQMAGYTIGDGMAEAKCNSFYVTAMARGNEDLLPPLIRANLWSGWR